MSRHRHPRTAAVLGTVLLMFAAALALPACKEPSKPIKPANIKRASDMEPIAAPMPPRTDSGESESAVPASQADPGAGMEIVEVQGYRGACDSTFVGINEDNLVTVRSGSQVRTYRLAGVSVPATAQLEAQNQVRIWLDKRSVSIETDDSVPALDAYAYLYVCPGGAMINEELVRAGLAVPSEARYRRTDTLKKASVEALTAGRGVWGKRSQ